MKALIFIDGQNFYRSLLRFDDTLVVDYDRLAAWVTHAVGGPNAVFAGAHYYVGVSPGAPAPVESFLKGLEGRTGYFVRRERRVRRTGRCSVCGGEYEYTTEKRVDTRLVADLIHFAANDAYDAAVLVSGDDDFVPAVEAVNALGKQVWVATLSPEELSSDLRVRCFGHIDLRDGVTAFRADRARSAERGGGGRFESRSGPLRGITRVGALAPEQALERALAELQRAEARLPHVSRGYFVTRWKAHQLPPPGQDRDLLVQQLVEAGLAEEFEVTAADGRLITAIRSRERDEAGQHPSESVMPGSATQDAVGDGLDGARDHLGAVP
jgi:NYN domain